MPYVVRNDLYYDKDVPTQTCLSNGMMEAFWKFLNDNLRGEYKVYGKPNFEKRVDGKWEISVENVAFGGTMRILANFMSMKLHEPHWKVV